jgi:DNA-directed RNA polymerase subunit RPC12/RpoP
VTVCPKCGGRLIVERELLDGDNLKCLNCGYRGGAMPRFKTEEGKQRWLASMAALEQVKRQLIQAQELVNR